MTQTNEAAFETVIETHRLANCYATMLVFIRATQPKDYGFRTLVHEVVQSRVFLMK